MKYAIVIPDGAADEPLDSLNGKTPLQAAFTPNLDSLAAAGILGTACNVPNSLQPGSDVATLSLLGYDPLEAYSGRAPLEAVAQKIQLTDHDWAIRCNLVTIENGTMKSFSADHISTPEATELLKSAQQKLADWVNADIQFVPSVSYRNLLIWRGRFGSPAPFDKNTQTYAPHDYTDLPISPVLPSGSGSEELRRLMSGSESVFKDHCVNKQRILDGKLPATQIWLWGQGKKPQITPFVKKYGIKRGAMITAVDLLRGIARSLNWDIIRVPGITGYIDTDYAAKGRYAASALKKYDIVCVHIEAPDEAGHEGNAEMKIKAIEEIDKHVIPPIIESLQKSKAWRILISPDHPTPVSIKTHSRKCVPWLMCGTGISAGKEKFYDEASAIAANRHFQNGHDLMRHFVGGANGF